MVLNSKPSKLFVGWQQGSPKERALTYDPDGWDCSKLASLADVAELADAGLDEFPLAEDDAGSFVECARTGDCFELQEGVFVASWEPGILQPEDHFLFFVEASTSKRHEIW